MGRLAESWDVLVSAQRRLHDVREKVHRNFDGGDAGHQWDHALVVRHAVNYAVAVQLASSVSSDGAIIDVGAGAGGFSVWAARALRRPLVIVDQDAGHRDLARRAFSDVDVHASTDHLPPAPVVFCMEVVEHVPSVEQPGFVRELSRLVADDGVLVMSTPDESGFWGGWSGYPPHVAPLDAEGLSELLEQELPGWSHEVLRITGPGFGLSTVARYGVPVANRVWGSLDSRVPRLTHEVAYRLNQLGKRRADPAPPSADGFGLLPALGSTSTGLVAVARPEAVSDGS